MKNNLIISIIGRSGSGKTTFICNLLEEKVGTILKEIASENEEGQTKIKTRYHIGYCNHTKISKIEFYEKIKKEKLIDYGFDNNIIEKIDDSDEDLLVIYVNNAKIDIKEFYKKYINNKKMRDIIKSIDLELPARKEIEEIIRNNGLENITIIDTRGEGDGIRFDIERYEKSLLDTTNKDKVFEILAAERGIIESSISILFTDTSGLRITNDEEHFKKFLAEIIRSKPLVVISRSAILTEKEENGDCYDDLINELEKKDEDNTIVFRGKLKYEHCFKTTVDLLNKIRNEKEFNSIYYNYIIDNIKYLLIPDIDKNSKEQQTLYKKNQELVLDKVLKYNDEYNKNISLISKKFEDRQFANDVFKRLNESIKTYFDMNDKYIKNNEEELNKRFKQNSYRNNFVGERYGITTNGGKPACWIILEIYDAIKNSIDKFDIENSIKQFMFEKLDNDQTMLDYTITYGHKINRKFCEKLYNELNKREIVNYNTIVDELIRIVLEEYKEYLKKE